MENKIGFTFQVLNAFAPTSGGGAGLLDPVSKRIPEPKSQHPKQRAEMIQDGARVTFLGGSGRASVWIRPAGTPEISKPCLLSTRSLSVGALLSAEHQREGRFVPASIRMLLQYPTAPPASRSFLFPEQQWNLF